MARFKIVEGSQSAHCCFEATVVDTSRPVIIGGKHFDNQFKPVCESFDVESAQEIAAALNAQNWPR